MNTSEKYTALQEHLKCLGSVAVAYSGGTDSTFLLKTAHDILGDKAVAVTVSSCVIPERELDDAKDFCKSEGIRHVVCDFDVFSIDGFAANPDDRCYICKKQIFGEIRKAADDCCITHIAEGTNLDDADDYRPGLRALEELGVLSPLREANLSKNDIRTLSKELGLQTWDKPALACLATRFVYGETITPQKISIVDSAEQLLLDLGFSQVRVRCHGDIARVEVHPNEFDLLVRWDNRAVVYASLQDMGFKFITMDLGGYRTGSMNDTLDM